MELKIITAEDLLNMIGGDIVQHQLISKRSAFAISRTFLMKILRNFNRRDKDVKLQNHQWMQQKQSPCITTLHAIFM